ncbi:MMPL family transporter [Vibrio sp. B1Z05]|uniref:MMPL family transporter n=1 Tax=Vibrio sp. B1Z05 TaxID=2654980 RepID=UPI001329E3B9|nr:MMPL family transporter [Vibrio sp. B1Z05]
MQRFTTLIIRFPKLLLLLLVSVTMAAAFYGVKHFSINADLSELVVQKGPWRDNLDEVEAKFPDTGNIVVVVSSKDDRQAKMATQRLFHAFKSDKQFTDVLALSTLPWFEHYAVGFLNKTEFAAFQDKVSLLMPDATALMKTQHLSGYLAALDSALSEPKSEQELSTLLQPIIQASNDKDVDWRGLLFANIAPKNGYVITLNALFDAQQADSNKLTMSAVRNVISSVGMPADVMVRVTGQTALDFDEVQDANSSVKLAGVVSLIALILILAVGIRSLRIIAASYLAVLVGLIWTFSAGLLLVGAFNTISIVFMVIFIGLGVDFAVHLSLHIYEQRLKGHDNDQSLLFSIQHSIYPLGLCALSSAIGFLSFYPTAYAGLGELGIISAAGMILGLLATFLVIPLFFQFFGYPEVKRSHTKRSKAFMNLGQWIITYHRRIIKLTFVGACITVFGAMQFKFDFSTLVLKNKNSESVETLQWLQDHKLSSNYQLFAVAKDKQQARQWQQQLANKPEVATTVSALSYLPNDFSNRVAQLQKIADLPSIGHAQAMSWNAFFDKHADLLVKNGINITRGDITNASILALKRHLTAELQPLSTLLTQGGQVTEPRVAMLPDDIRSKYVSDDGEWLVSVLPSGNMRDVTAVNAFVSAVQQVAPLATGRAVAEQNVGDIVVKAFYIAIGISIVSITFILFLTVEHKRDIIFIFIPLLLTTSTTLAIAHWFGQSLNMANIIVIPLIFGLGVDNGIHIVKRFRHEQTITRFFAASTPKATLISCLTTIATFGALTLSDHQGMHSIGVLLSIALSAILCFSLLILPAFLHRFEPN